jgi:four helix bundle protein
MNPDGDMRPKVASHRELRVWQMAMDLTEQVYQISARFPAIETYRMAMQLTRAAISVPANIAEGNARGSRKDYAHFLGIAKGSLMEAETYVLLAIRLKYLSEEEARPLLALVTDISKMLTSLRSRLLSA